MQRQKPEPFLAEVHYSRNRVIDSQRPQLVTFFGSDWCNGVAQPVIVSRRFPFIDFWDNLLVASTAASTALRQSTAGSRLLSTPGRDRMVAVSCRHAKQLNHLITLALRTAGCFIPTNQHLKFMLALLASVLVNRHSWFLDCLGGNLCQNSGGCH